MLASVNPLGVVGPLTLPPRLVLRALDDLHAIATAAREISAALDGFERRADAVGGQLDAALALLARIETMGERIDARAEAILGMGQRIEQSATAVLDQGMAVEQAARELALSGAALAEALPTLQRGLEIAEPLEGVVERLGRMVDRLPGGPRRAAGPGPAAD
jgi:ABC-type transporter Mla subunit MlaD